MTFTHGQCFIKWNGFSELCDCTQLMQLMLEAACYGDTCIYYGHILMYISTKVSDLNCSFNVLRMHFSITSFYLKSYYTVISLNPILYLICISLVYGCYCVPGESEIKIWKVSFICLQKIRRFTICFWGKNCTLNLTKTFKAEASFGANEMKCAKQIYSPRIEINSVHQLQIAGKNKFEVTNLEKYPKVFVR